MSDTPAAVTPARTAVEVNDEFYGQAPIGQQEYWRYMAAPRHRVAVLTELLREAQPASVVDLGCGDGALLRSIEDAVPGARLAGIDLSARQVEINRDRSPGVEWHAADLDRDAPAAELPSDSFDAVVAMEVIEHLDHPLEFLRTARRLAAGTGARLYLSTQSGRVGETERRVGHRRHYTADEMRALLGEAGWVPVRVWNTGYPFHDLSKWYANRDPDGSMRSFGEGRYGPYQRFVCWALRLAFRLNSGRSGAQLFALAAPAE